METGAALAVAVGACDATWAGIATLARSTAPITSADFIASSFLHNFENQGREHLSPSELRQLERRASGAAVHLVGFATMALAAELRRLVGVGRRAARVVGTTHEEHGGVVA